MPQKIQPSNPIKLKNDGRYEHTGALETKFGTTVLEIKHLKKKKKKKKKKKQRERKEFFLIFTLPFL